MSTLQEDIKQLRSAFEYELISQDLERPVHRVCDALEARLNPHLGSSFNEYAAKAAEELAEKLEASLKDNDGLSQSFYDCNKYAVELEARLKSNEVDLDRFAALNSDLIDEKAKLSEALRSLIESVKDIYDYQPDLDVPMEMARKALGEDPKPPKKDVTSWDEIE